MIELRVLGPPRIDAAGAKLAGSMVPHRKRLALLAYLAAATPRGPHSRDTLLALFWPESGDARARAALNQALYVLRSWLGEDVFLSRRSDEVELNPDAVWCDAPACEIALDEGRPAEALELYRGDLLEGLLISGAPEFERWVDRERRRLSQRASEGAWALASEHASRGDAVQAERWARRAAELVPGEEVVLRRLMTFLHDLGDRAAALSAYSAFTARLMSEYELEPSAETLALVAAIRDERPAPAGPAVAVATASVAHVPDPPGEPGSAPSAVGRRSSGARLGWRLGWRLGLAAAVVIALVSVPSTWARLAETDAPTPTAGWLGPMSLGDGPRLADGITGSTIALSRTRDFAYVGEDGLGQRLFLKRSHDASASAVPGTEGADQPFFSPDGLWLGFVAGGFVRKVPLAGGPPVDVGAVPARVVGASWGDDDTIVFGTSEALWRLPAAGGVPAPIAIADSTLGQQYRWPDVLPGGRAAVLTIVTPTGFALATVSMASGEVRPLGVAGTSPRFVEPDRLVFARIDGTLLTAPFDARSLRITGRVTQLAEGAQVGTGGAAKLGISSTALAYMPMPPAGALALVDRSGRAQAVPVRARSLRPTARFTPDGTAILITVNEPEASWADIWRVELANGDLRRITFDSGSVVPVMGGRRSWPIAYATARAGRVDGFEVRLLRDRSALPETLLAAAAGQVPADFTPDGDVLVFQRLDPGTQRDIWLLPLQGSGAATPYLDGPANERSPALSPDARWLAWTSDESGQDEVYVSTFPERGATLRVSTGGGREPKWSRDGQELFYRGGEGMIAVTITAEPELSLGRRATLFDDSPYLGVANNVGYDVHPDGRFLMLRKTSAGDQVLLWLDWRQGLEG